MDTNGQEYAFIDPRIVLFHKDNRGLSNARNFGIRHSHGDFIGFVDSDDYLPLDAYEKLLKGFEWETAYEIVVTNGMIIQFYHGEADQKSLMRAEEWSRSDYQLIEGRNMCQAMLSEQSNHYVHTKLYKKDVFKHIIFHEGRNDEDTIFTYELGKVMKSLNWAMVEVPSETYYYRIRPESICTSTTKPLRIDRLCNLRWILKDVKEEMPEIVELVLRLQVRTLLWFSDEFFPIGIGSKNGEFNVFLKSGKQRIKSQSNAYQGSDIETTYSLNIVRFSGIYTSNFIIGIIRPYYILVESGIQFKGFP